MQYHEYKLSSPLNKYIQTIWSMESENEEDIYPRSIIMPDGIVEIIFHYEAPFYTWQGDRQFLQHENFAVSMMRQHIEIASSGKTGFISVRFFPWGGYHFFNVPVRNFLDQTIDAKILWGEDSEKVVRELKNLHSIEERFKLIAQFLSEKLTEYQKNEEKTDKAIQLIRQTKGALTIEDIYTETGFSKKQLERKFVATVGVNPKVFSRITRFLNICQNLETQQDLTLTQLTHDCGFYDQSHFIKEFKAFSGFTPKDFFGKENIYFSEI